MVRYLACRKALFPPSLFREKKNKKKDVKLGGVIDCNQCVIEQQSHFELSLISPPPRPTKQANIPPRARKLLPLCMAANTRTKKTCTLPRETVFYTCLHVSDRAAIITPSRRLCFQNSPKTRLHHGGEGGKGNNGPPLSSGSPERENKNFAPHHEPWGGAQSFPATIPAPTNGQRVPLGNRF